MCSGTVFVTVPEYFLFFIVKDEIKITEKHNGNNVNKKLLIYYCFEMIILI